MEQTKTYFYKNVALLDKLYNRKLFKVHIYSAAKWPALVILGSYSILMNFVQHASITQLGFSNIFMFANQQSFKLKTCE